MECTREGAETASGLQVTNENSTSAVFLVDDEIEVFRVGGVIAGNAHLIKNIAGKC